MVSKNEGKICFYSLEAKRTILPWFSFSKNVLLDFTDNFNVDVKKKKQIWNSSENDTVNTLDTTIICELLSWYIEAYIWS